MKMSVISLGDKITDNANSLCFVAIFIIETNAKFQLAVCENTAVIFFSCKFTDPLNSTHSFFGLRTSFLEGVT